MADQIAKAVASGTYFVSGCLAVVASQILGGPIYLMNEDWYNAWIAFTKQSFGLLTTTLTQWWAPTVIRISGDKSVRGQLLKTVDGGLFCNFPERLVLMANHQIYTDWLYLWWIAYTNGMHGRIYIILKESLKSIPVIGWGIQLSQFIFMKRNWEKDKPHLAAHLQKLNNPADPMWLLIFPEGTNLAPDTRQRSALWAETQGITDMHHLLLPRSTGLQFCLQQLHRTVPYIYDCTIAYEGVKHGQYAQDIFTIQQAYLKGQPPKSVNMYWRRFAVSTIPFNDAKAFEHWLRSRWHEKDMLINGYLRTGRFPADDGIDKLPDGTIRRGAGYIETEVKAFKWYEFLQIFAPIGLFALILYTFYDSLPNVTLPSIDTDAMGKKLQLLQKNLATAVQNNHLAGTNKKVITDGVNKTLLQAKNRASKKVTNQNALLKSGTAQRPLLIEVPPKTVKTTPTNAHSQKKTTPAVKLPAKPKKLEIKPHTKSTLHAPAQSKPAAKAQLKPAAKAQTTTPAKKAVAKKPAPKLQAAPAKKQPVKQPPKSFNAGSSTASSSSASSSNGSSSASSVSDRGPPKLEIKPKAKAAPKKIVAKPMVHQALKKAAAK
ncbi:hypothetical protein MMC11_007719 [Xylographa trunciseda]|nr:hypothetical protein [Xylographa trunciseda]